MDPFRKITFYPATFIHKYSFQLLLTFWALIQSLVFFVFGIVTTGEATKYSFEAENLLNTGHFSEGKYIFYSAYILLHIFFKLLGFETIGVYIVQLLINLLSMYLLFKLVVKLSKNNATAFVCVLLMIACYSWQLWAVHLYTESLFCPLIIIFTYVLFAMQKSFKQKLTAGLLFLLILFTRPTGLLFIPVIGLLIMYKLYTRKKILALVYGLIACSLFLVVLNYAMESGTSYDFIKPLVQNYVICDVPLNEQVSVQSSSLQNVEGNLPALVNYIIQNPGSFFKMAGLKFLSFWGMTRPYYSYWHNLAFMCFFYPLFFLGFIGAFKLRKINGPFILFSVGSIIIFTLSVMFTCDDWNNRFIMPILPFVIIFASFGIKYLYNKAVTKNIKPAL